jgi:hypothetical protein
MKLGAVSLFERIHAHGTPTSGVLIAALHWQWSLTWRWILTWYPIGQHRHPRLYWMRTHRGRGLNFLTGARIPLLGHLAIHTQPNMRKHGDALWR